MFKILVWALLYTHAEAESQQQHIQADRMMYQACYICVEDTDPTHTKMCDKWLSSKGKEFSYRQKVKKDSFLKGYDINSNSNQCKSLFIYGAYHANQNDVKLPFTISKKMAQIFSSKNICYDGYSCLIFDNLDDVKACAKDLAEDNCKYQISGNQNIGWQQRRFFMGCPVTKPTELYEAASRMLVTIEGAQINVDFAECTKPKLQCALKLNLDASKNDPNTKWCRSGGIIVNQVCCANNKRIRGTPDGHWSAPGEPCSK